jgi:hypothetical protein
MINPQTPAGPIKAAINNAIGGASTMTMLSFSAPIRIRHMAAGHHRNVVDAVSIAVSAPNFLSAAGISGANGFSELVILIPEG